MRKAHRKGLLTATERAEVQKIRIRVDQMKQALDEAGRLSQRNAEDDFHRQAGLNDGITANELSSTLVDRLRRSRHGRIEPDTQRPEALDRLVFRESIQCLVARGVRSTLPDQLQCWFLDIDPSWN